VALLREFEEGCDRVLEDTFLNRLREIFVVAAQISPYVAHVSARGVQSADAVDVDDALLDACFGCDCIRYGNKEPFCDGVRYTDDVKFKCS
jgi:hypothetical protein